MIKFHFDTDFDTTAMTVASDGRHYLFIVNPDRLAYEPWARERIANQLTAMALTPPPGLTAEVIDLQEFRQWCEVMNGTDARPHSASV